MRATAYTFEKSYKDVGLQCTVYDLPNEGIYGNDHMMFQDLNNDVIADHIENWIINNVDGSNLDSKLIKLKRFAFCLSFLLF